MKNVHDVDIIIVGAGIIGLSVADYLQDAGKTVMLIDRKGIALEASWGNAGALAFTDVLPLASPGIMRKAPRWLLDPLGPLSIRPTYLPQIAPWLYHFWRASRPERVRANTVAQCELLELARSEMGKMLERNRLAHMVRSDGALQLYESRAEFEAAQPGWKLREEMGMAFEHIHGDAIGNYQPGLSSRFISATFTPAWQTVTEPYELACSIGERILQRGGLLVVGEVTILKPDVSGGVAITLKSGDILKSRQAVVAAGAWSHHLVSKLGERIPLETERGYNTTLPPGAFDLKRQLTFGGHGFVITPLSSGIRVGGAVEFGGLQLPPQFKRSSFMLQKAKKFLPGLQLEGGKQWMGFRPSLPDSLPAIGTSGISASIVYAFGHGHLGLTQCAATGRLVKDILLGRKTPIRLAPFRPSRFS